MILNREQLIEIFDIVFEKSHSDGFKKAEMMDMLYDNEYRFLEKPRNCWLFKLREYVKENGINYSEFDINPKLIELGEKAETDAVIENES